MLATKPILSKGSKGKLVRLRSAAHALFITKGYHDTRPQDIAREAGVANGTFYMHFDGKQAAFLDFAEQAQQSLIEHLEKNLSDIVGLRNRWRVIVETVIDHALSHPGVLNAAFLDPVLIAPESEDAWHLYERMGKLVELALHQTEEGKQIEDVNLTLISHGITGMLRHAMTYASRNKAKDLCPDQLADELSLFIYRGLGF